MGLSVPNNRHVRPCDAGVGPAAANEEQLGAGAPFPDIGGPLSTTLRRPGKNDFSRHWPFCAA